MYNNPYIYQNLARPSLLSRLFGGASLGSKAASGINWGTLLSNTQKSLGIINQAIPIVYQVKPMFNNVKTMFKIANAVNGSNNTKTNNVAEKKEVTNTSYDNKPIFYI